MELRLNGTAGQHTARTADLARASSEPPTVAAKAAPTELAAASAVQQAAAAAPPAQLSEALQNINTTMRALAQDLEFSVDPDSNRTIVKVVDQRTQEVIRQMPSAEALEIAKALDRVQGLLIRQKA